MNVNAIMRERERERERERGLIIVLPLAVLLLADLSSTAFVHIFASDNLLVTENVNSIVMMVIVQSTTFGPR
jgi:hypothetical protein